jgi:hypothetical protein
MGTYTVTGRGALARHVLPQLGKLCLVKLLQRAENLSETLLIVGTAFANS